MTALQEHHACPALHICAGDVRLHQQLWQGFRLKPSAVYVWKDTFQTYTAVFLPMRCQQRLHMWTFAHG
jgi:hypothetical protein